MHYFVNLKNYTSFLDLKNDFRCVICQMPESTITAVWKMLHHCTRELVESLVLRNATSRSRWYACTF